MTKAKPGRMKHNMSLTNIYIPTPIAHNLKPEEDMFLRKVRNLPDLMKTVLNNPAMVENSIKLEEKYYLSPSRHKAMIFLEGDVAVKNVIPNGVLHIVQKDIVANDQQAKQFTVDFLGLICLPMQWYIGNVEGLIKELGGNLEPYLAEAKKNYPEVYTPVSAQPAPAKEPAAAKDTGEEPSILRQIEERLTSAKGRAEVLLRLTALSQQIEEAVKTQRLDAAAGQELLHSLDALSYAVNTKDLNPLEVAAIKRRLKNVVMKLGQSPTPEPLPN